MGREAESESFGSLKAKVVADFERSYLCTLLKQHRGNIGHAARAARKNRRVFFQLMRKHQISVQRPGTESADSQVAKVVIRVGK